MAVIFMDGFDYYQGTLAASSLTGDLAKRWTGNTSSNSGSVASIGPAYARTPGGQGIYLPVYNAGFVYKAMGVNMTSGVFGFAQYNPSVSWASRTLHAALDGTTEQISVRTNASSQLTVTRAGTVLATGTTVLTAGQWYYIELKFTIDPSAGVVELRLNGASEIASTGSLNTRNTANTQWNAFGLQMANGCSPYVDDIYVLDSNSPNNDFLGPIRVVALQPTGNGTTLNWTPNGDTNFGAIADLSQDGDTSFTHSATPNNIDTFTMQDLPIASGSVVAVATHVFARQDSGDPRTIAPVLRIGSTDYAGTTVALTTNYQNLTQTYNTSPATSSAWAISEVNGLEAGYKLVS